MRKMFRRGTAGFLSFTLFLGLCGTDFGAKVQAATEHWNDASAEATSWTNWKASWSSLSTDYENVSLTPGEDETQLNYAWYSHTEETPKVKVSTSSDMENATEYPGTQTAITLDDLTDYFSNKVTITGLTENTTYYYQVYQNGAYQDVETYKTGSFSDYSFLYVGDPQIGACKSQTSSEDITLSEDSENYAARNDAYNWNEILNDVVSEHSDLSFMVSAGDQVNTATSEIEYAGYLGADALSSLAVATTIGNHDSKSSQYSLHYNNPNSFTSDETDYTEGSTVAGTDYYYTYGEVLFIVLDTNNYNCATHENVIKKAISENKDAKWRVVTFHQDIYGSGADHSDSDGIVLRTQLTPLMDEYDIDVVLQGHDHTYSRSYQLSSDGQEHTSYDSSTYTEDENYLTQNDCYDITSDTESGTIVNPEGTVYMEANSATGSKFYNLITSQQDYIAERSQTWTPSYSIVDVTASSFTITTYDATTGEELAGSSSYTIVKEDEKSEQKINSVSTLTKSLNSKSFTLNASSNGNGKLTYTSSDKSVATISAKGKVTLKGIGTTALKVTAAATDSYTKATKTIKLTVTPKKQTVKATSVKKTQAKVSWTKDSTISGVELVVSSDKNFKKNVTTYLVKSKNVTSKTIKGLTSGKKYYVKVRSYKKVNGTYIYSSYSTVKSVKAK